MSATTSTRHRFITTGTRPIHQAFVLGAVLLLCPRLASADPEWHCTHWLYGGINHRFVADHQVRDDGEPYRWRNAGFQDAWRDDEWDGTHDDWPREGECAYWGVRSGQESFGRSDLILDDDLDDHTSLGWLSWAVDYRPGGAYGRAERSGTTVRLDLNGHHATVGSLIVSTEFEPDNTRPVTHSVLELQGPGEFTSFWTDIGMGVDDFTAWVESQPPAVSVLAVNGPIGAFRFTVWATINCDILARCNSNLPPARVGGLILRDGVTFHVGHDELIPSWIVHERGGFVLGMDVGYEIEGLVNTSFLELDGGTVRANIDDGTFLNVLYTGEIRGHGRIDAAIAGDGRILPSGGLLRLGINHVPDGLDVDPSLTSFEGSIELDGGEAKLDLATDFGLPEPRTYVDLGNGGFLEVTAGITRDQRERIGGCGVVRAALDEDNFLVLRGYRCAPEIERPLTVHEDTFIFSNGRAKFLSDVDLIGHPVRLVNDGTEEANDPLMNIGDGGTLTVEADSEIRARLAVQAGGHVDGGDGRLSVQLSPVEIQQGGVFTTPDGGLDAAEVVNSGSFRPPPPGALPMGSFEQTGGGILKIHVGPRGAEQRLDVAGDVDLGGTLIVTFEDGYEPEAGSVFDIARAGVNPEDPLRPYPGEVRGTFRSVVNSNVGSMWLTVEYLPQVVRLHVEQIFFEPGTVVHVDQSARAGGDGETWRRAFRSLTEGIEAARGQGWVPPRWDFSQTIPRFIPGHWSVPPKPILVAAGTYHPETDLPDPREASFEIQPQMHLFGGFPPGGSDFMAREEAGLAETILSGDLGVAGDLTDNTYHVLRTSSHAARLQTIIDGFTVRDGNARWISTESEPAHASEGGGMRSVGWRGGLALSRCTFLYNTAAARGGAVYTTSDVQVTRSIFRGNQGGDLGGAIASTDASPILLNSELTGNEATDGAGLLTRGQAGSPERPLVINCTFHWNIAANRGGGIHAIDGVRLEVCNTDLSCNRAAGSLLERSQVDYTSEAPIIASSNLHVYDSCCNDGSTGSCDQPDPGEGNLAVNPLFELFADPGSGGWDGIDDDFGILRLLANSPLIGAGNDQAVVRGSVDLDGNPRHVGGVDIGAREFVAPPDVVTQPGSRSVSSGSDVTFEIEASGSPRLTYQWVREQVVAGNPIREPLTEGNGVRGARTPRLELLEVAPEDEAVEEVSYRCLVRNFIGEDQSEPAHLTILRQAPALSDDNAETLEEITKVIPVLDNDEDVDGDLRWDTAEITRPPQHGDVSWREDGVLNYVPAPNFTGVDDFEYRVGDAAGLTDTAEVEVIVHPLNDAPRIAVVSAVTLDEGETRLLPTGLESPDETPYAELSWGAVSADADVVRARVDASGELRLVGVEGPGSTTVELFAADRGDPNGCIGPEPECSPPIVASRIIQVTVENVAPTVARGTDQVGDEGTPAPLVSVTYSDPGVEDTHTAIVDWGDGSPQETGSATGGNVVADHAYVDDGVYDVTVCVTDDDADETCSTFPMTIADVPPTVDLGPNRSVDEGVLTSFPSVVYTDPGILDRHVANVSWGDGTPSETEPTSGGLVPGDHVYADDGTYVVEVCVEDETDPATRHCDTMELTVLNGAPTLALGPARTALEGELLDLPVDTFSDPGTLDTHQATVDWGDGAGPEPADVSESPFGPPGSTDGLTGTVSAEHVYADDGTYLVTVCVTDDDRAETCSTSSVEVGNAAPVVTLGTPPLVEEGGLVALPSATYNDPGTLDTHVATVDWGDGTGVSTAPVDGTPFGPPGSVSGQTGAVLSEHVYADDGTYTVQVCVTDDDDGEGCATWELDVANVAPSLALGGDRDLLEGELVALPLDTFSDAGTLDTHEATVDWGDGTGVASVVVDESPFGPPGSTDGLTGSLLSDHVYADDGTYTVQVCVTDDDGAETCGTVTCSVGNVAPVVSLGTPPVIDEGELIALPGDTFHDAGTLDTHVAIVDWGDGTGIASVVVDEAPFGPPGSTDGLTGSLLSDHVYADDGTYTVQVCVTDDDDGEGCATWDLEVRNVTPVVTLGPAPDLAEGELIALPVDTFHDAGTLDTHVATVDWGDGTGLSSVTVDEAPFGPPGSTDGLIGTAVSDHVYADDGPYVVQVCVTDDEDAEACATWDLDVRNVAPTVDAGPDVVSVEGGEVRLSPAVFNDPGTLDTHVARVNWGDELPPVDGVVTESPFGPPGDVAGLDGTVDSRHVYGDNGLFDVEVCVTDDDGGEHCDTLVVTVDNLDPELHLDPTLVVDFLGGGPGLLARRGEPRGVAVEAYDDGSDDLDFSWSVTDTYFGGTALFSDGAYHCNDPTEVDCPDRQPSSQTHHFPMEVGEETTVTFELPGVYDLGYSAEDDDGGRATGDAPRIVVTDNRLCAQNATFWKRQLDGRGPQEIAVALIDRYLHVVEFASPSFSELLCIAEHDLPCLREVVLEVLSRDSIDLGDGDPSNMRGKALGEVTAAWLNFAAGTRLWDEDVTGSGEPFHEAMARLEAVILDPSSSHGDLVRVKNEANDLNRELDHPCRDDP